jgi:hypothetical protein
MTHLTICFGLGRQPRFALRLLGLVSVVSLLSASLSPVQANVSLKSLALPKAVTRSVIIDNSEWQGVGVELEHLSSSATLEATLEQLAMFLPELTPVWSEQGVAHAHWIDTEFSYVLFLWATQTQTTEGLLSRLRLGRPQGVAHNTLPRQFAAIDWLPKQAQQLFRLTDNSGAQAIALSSFTLATTSSQLADHLKAYGQRNGWVRLPDKLTFFRDTRRLSFQVVTDKGHTTVLVYETSREAP